MKKILTLALSLWLTCIFATGAVAGSDIITASDHAKILEIAKGFGSAELTTTSKGTPIIQGRMDSIKYAIWFSGCTDGKNCSALQFIGMWKTENFPMAEVNKWNAQKVYTRTYLDNDLDLTMEMDVFMRYGMTKKNLEEIFDLWKTSLRHISEVIAAQSKKSPL
ncbi:YbjN domain-containing protein [Desulfovibrio sp.]|uniref:YbjN domain-containing protein n=1 Tax=Desulfovibrio sp. TaxID=885 RepID=UPI0025C6F6A4|nr:YbjN domain-containing protein [Desulfovibrio sp.]